MEAVMADELYPVAGQRIFIGGPISVGPVNLVEADFAAQTWTEIDGWTQHGQLGDTAALITTALINRNRDLKQKGTANAGSMANVFAIVPDDEGQLALKAAAQPDEKRNFAFRIWDNDTPDEESSVVTITIAAPGVFTWNAHPLVLNEGVIFTTTDTLPTGLVAGTTYYVKTIPSANTFTVSATPGGAAIATTVGQAGVHTATTVPVPSTRLFAGVVMSAQQQGGEANTVRSLNSTVEVNSNIVEVDPVGTVS
jgi:hypothetical protein